MTPAGGEKATTEAAKPTPANPYRPVRATLEDVIVETSTIKTFVIKPDETIPWVTGQFVEVDTGSETFF